nr:unnamed protein product [Digitaria exilis]
MPHPVTLKLAFHVITSRQQNYNDFLSVQKLQKTGRIAAADRRRSTQISGVRLRRAATATDQAMCSRVRSVPVAAAIAGSLDGVQANLAANGGGFSTRNCTSRTIPYLCLTAGHDDDGMEADEEVLCLAAAMDATALAHATSSSFIRFSSLHISGSTGRSLSVARNAGAGLPATSPSLPLAWNGRRRIASASRAIA